MILPKIDAENFLLLVRTAPVIAFQGGEYGYALAVPGEAYYAPLKHPGGGNLADPVGFLADLGDAFLKRMETPALRTLRPTARPTPTAVLEAYLHDISGALDDYAKAAGDHPAVIEYETQIVVLAIEEHGRPDLKGVKVKLNLEVLSDAMDLVIEHAEAVRELSEVGDYKPDAIRLNLLQASTAMKTALSYLLTP